MNSVANAPIVWHAVVCKPRQEHVAAENLVRQGFVVYLPRIAIRRRRRGVWRDCVEALFPRYLFVRVTLGIQNTAPIRSTRGAIGLVSFGMIPAVVPQELIEEIRAREDATTGIHGEIRCAFHEGEPVSILEGPLAGMGAIYQRNDGEKRSLLLIELLGKTHRVTVDRNALRYAA